MYGAIYGDLVGSLYEYDEYQKHDKIRMLKASNEPNLVTDESFISDDTILTVAVAEASLTDEAYSKVLRRYVLDNILAKRNNYFKYNFSPGTINWAKGDKQTSSNGNGAMMRISSVPTYFSDKHVIVSKTLDATTSSHNSQEAIRAALCISNMIYYAKNGYTKDEIELIVREKFKYFFDYSLEELRSIDKFNMTCKDTIGIVLYTLFNTNSFDDAIRMCLSFGKDTDTNCCIVGSVAEHFYGVPDYVKEIVEAKIPNEYKEIVDKIYKCKLT